MPYLEPLEPSSYSFEERVGAPHAFDAGIGRVAIGFSYLEDTLSRAIGRLLAVGSKQTAAITSEMSFRNKVHLFASLVRLQMETETIDLGNLDPEKYLRELTAACFKIEERRNAVMHSSWAVQWVDESISYRRRKTSAKATRGVHIHEEVLTAADMLDIYDYAAYISVLIDELS